MSTESIGEIDVIEGQLVLRLASTAPTQAFRQMDALPGWRMDRGSSRFKKVPYHAARQLERLTTLYSIEVSKVAARMIRDAPPVAYEDMPNDLGFSALSFKEWELPTIAPIVQESAFAEELSQVLTRTLRELNIPCEVTRTLVGPTTVRFELLPDTSVRMRDFTALGRPQDVAFALEAESVRIQAPIPGRRLVGMEIASPHTRIVELGEVIGEAEAPLRAALGVTPDCETVGLELSGLPHLLIAGGSGSGKSTLMHTIICSLLVVSTPDDLRLVLIDPKRVELRRYRGVPHLAFAPVVEPSEAVVALESLVDEAVRRYMILESYDAQNLHVYNSKVANDERLPAVLCMVDELADLMRYATKRVERAVERLSQLGRACGVHLVLATQSPQRKVLSGSIKQNVSARIALQTAEAVDSRVAMDQPGAELLRGRGDALLRDGGSVAPRRFQSAYPDDRTIEQIVSHWRRQRDESTNKEETDERD